MPGCREARRRSNRGRGSARCGCGSRAPRSRSRGCQSALRRARAPSSRARRCARTRSVTTIAAVRSPSESTSPCATGGSCRLRERLARCPAADRRPERRRDVDARDSRRQAHSRSSVLTSRPITAGLSPCVAVAIPRIEQTIPRSRRRHDRRLSVGALDEVQLADRLILLDALGDVDERLPTGRSQGRRRSSRPRSPERSSVRRGRAARASRRLLPARRNAGGRSRGRSARSGASPPSPGHRRRARSRRRPCPAALPRRRAGQTPQRRCR